MTDGEIELVIEAQNKASSQIEEVRKTVEDLKKSFGDVSQKAAGFRDASSHVDSFGASLLNATKTVATFATAMGVLEAVKGTFSALADATIGFNSTLQQSQAAWKTMLGGTEAASKAAEALQAQLQQFNTQTPFEFPGVDKAAQAIFRLTGDVKSLVPILTDVVNGVAATGEITQGRLESVIRAFEQIGNKGKLSAEEVNQLAENGIPLWKILSEEMGKPIPVLQKLAEQGQVSADTVLNAFRNFSKEHYGQAAAEQAKTFQGAMSNVSDSAKNLAATASKPFFQLATDVANALANLLSTKEVQDWATKIAAYVSIAVDALRSLAGAFTSALGDVQTTVDSVGQAIYEGLQWLNPWASHSPPLVESVQSGVDAINKAFGGISVSGSVDAMKSALESFRSAVDALVSTASGVPDKLKAIFENLPEASAAYQAVVTSVNAAKDALGPLKDQYDAQVAALVPFAQAVSNAEAAMKPYEEAVKAAEAALAPFADAVKAAESAVKDKEAAVKAAEASMQPYNDAIKAAEDGLNAYRDAIDRAKDGVTQQQEAVDRAKESLARHQDELDNLKDKLKGVDDEIQTHVGNLKEYEQQANDAAAAIRGAAGIPLAGEGAFNQQINDANKALNDQQKLLDQTKNSDAYKGLQSQIDAAQQKLKDLNKTSGGGNFADQIYEAEKKLRDLQKQPVATGDKAADDAKKAAIEQQQKLLEGLRDKARDAGKAQADQANQIRDGIDKLKGQQEAMLDPIKAEIERRKELLQQIKDQKAAAIDEARARIKAAQDEALGIKELTEGAILEQIKRNKELIDQAKQRAKDEQETIDALKRGHNDLNETYKNQKKIVDDARKAVENEESKLKDRTAAVKAAEDAYKNQQKAVENAKKAAEEHSKVIEDAKKALDDANAALDASKEAYSGQVDKVNAAKDAVNEHKDAVTKAKDAYAEQKKGVDEAKKAYDEQKHAIADTEGQLKSLSQAVIAAAKEQSDAAAAGQGQNKPKSPLLGGLEDAQKALDDAKKKFADTKAEIVKSLEPVTSLVGDIIGRVKGYVDTFINAAGGIDNVTKVVQGALAGIATALGAWTSLSAVSTILGGIVTVLGALVTPVGLVVAAAAALGAAFQTNFGGIRDIVQSVFGFVIQTAGQVSDAFQSGGLEAAINTLVAAFQSSLPAITKFASDVLSTLGTAVGQLVAWLAQQAQPIFEAVSKWGLALLSWIGPTIPDMLGALGGMLVSLGTWITNTALPAIVGFVAEWGGAFINWIAPLIGPALAQLGSFLSGITTWALTVAAPQLFQSVQQWGLTFINWIGPSIAPMLEAAGSLLLALTGWSLTVALPAIISTVVQWGTALAGWVAPAIPALMTQLGALSTQFVAWITGQVSALTTGFQTWATAFVAWIGPATATFLAQWPTMFSQFLDWIGAQAGPLLLALGQWGIQFVAWIVPKIPDILVALGYIAGAIVVFIVETAVVLAEKLLQWGIALVGWIIPQIPTLLANLGTFFNSIGPFIDTTVEWLKKAAINLGKAIIYGIISGLQATWGDLTTQAGKTLSDLLTFMSGPKGINSGSPSQVYADAIGKPIAQGIAEGISSLSTGPDSPVGAAQGMLTTLTTWASGDGLTAIQTSLASWTTAFADVFNGIGTVTANASVALASFVSDLLPAVSNAMVTILDMADARVIASFGALAVSIIDQGTAISKSVNSVFGRDIPTSLQISGAEVMALQSKFAQAASGVDTAGHDIGKALTDGVARGIADGLNDVVSQAQMVAQAAENAMRSSLQIHSPSAVFRDIGNQTAQGFIVGMQDEQAAVRGTAGDLVGTLSGTTAAVATAGSFAPAVGGGGSGGDTIYVTVEGSVVTSEDLADELARIYQRRKRQGGQTP